MRTRGPCLRVVRTRWVSISAASSTTTWLPSGDLVWKNLDKFESSIPSFSETSGINVPVPLDMQLLGFVQLFLTDGLKQLGDNCFKESENLLALTNKTFTFYRHFTNQKWIQRSRGIGKVILSQRRGLLLITMKAIETMISQEFTEWYEKITQ